MKVTDLIEQNYYSGLSKEPINESISSVVNAIEKGVEKISKMIQIGKPKEETNKFIQEFVSKYRVPYVAIRSILSVDQYLSKDDTDGATYVGSLYNALTIGKPEEVKEELVKFYNYAKQQNSKLKRTIEYFDKAVDHDLKSQKDGIIGYNLVKEMKDHIDNIRQMSADYINRYAKPVSENIDFVGAIEKFVEQGLLDEFETAMLNESATEAEEKNFYAIVEAQLTIDGKKHRNLKSVVATRAKDAVEAFKNIKRDVRSSVSDINKIIKKDRGHLKLTKLEDIKIFNSFEEIKKKNLSNLVGTEYVSRGFMILDGALEHGNMKSEPKYYPMGYTFLQKSAITRYLKGKVA